ncbi:MAG: hypothetical protein JO356_08055 [Acidobacteria bacterium]|nr:hypothetical protein [Acidobacteriota bacterium]
MRRLLHDYPELVRLRSQRIHQAPLLHYVAANGIEDFRQKTPKNIVEIAKLLLESGAEVNAESNAYGGGPTALGLAATSVHPQRARVQEALMQILLDHGAVIDRPGVLVQRACTGRQAGHTSVPSSCLSNAGLPWKESTVGAERSWNVLDRRLRMETQMETICLYSTRCSRLVRRFRMAGWRGWNDRTVAKPAPKRVSRTYYVDREP